MNEHFMYGGKQSTLAEEEARAARARRERAENDWKRTAIERVEGGFIIGGLFAETRAVATTPEAIAALVLAWAKAHNPATQSMRN